jgi:hypothetical protein
MAKKHIKKVKPKQPAADISLSDNGCIPVR